MFVNHETSQVPFPYSPATDGGELAERLRQLAAQPAQPEPARRAGCSRASFAIPSSANYQRFCSNYLATKEEGFEPADSCSRTRRRRTGCSARDGVAAPITPGRRAEQTRRRRRATTCGTASTRRSTAWAGTTTRTTSRSPGSSVRSSSRATTRSAAPAVAALHVHREERGRGLERQGHAVGVQVATSTRSTTTTTSSGSASVVGARSSRCPRRSRSETQTGARELVDTANATSSQFIRRRGHRLRPQEARTTSTMARHACERPGDAEADDVATRVGAPVAEPARASRRTAASGSSSSTRTTRRG